MVARFNIDSQSRAAAARQLQKPTGRGEHRAAPKATQPAAVPDRFSRTDMRHVPLPVIVIVCALNMRGAVVFGMPTVSNADLADLASIGKDRMNTAPRQLSEDPIPLRRVFNTFLWQMRPCGPTCGTQSSRDMSMVPHDSSRSG